MEKKRPIAGTSRPAEEAYLKETLAVVHDNVENYGREVARMQEDIDVMLEHYHDNDVEVLTILNNTITMHDHMKRALSRNEKAMKKPYFGRIVFRDEALSREESLYIGRGGISRDTTHWMVVDWRAPVANAYYENGLGKCSYPAPGGAQVDIDLRLKRTYEIEDGKLLDYFDTEVIANDDLLTKYLAKNKQAVLGEIIATIQKEQNDIIRKSPYHNVIVQGVAGSGKTTVAMHRISFILYNYQERFRPEDFYIVGSNRILLDYITGVLPDLDVYGIRQMTMEQLFVRLLYEDWDEAKYRIRHSDQMGKRGAVRGTLSWFLDLEKWCNRLEWDTIPRQSVFLNPKQFVEGLRDGKSGVYDETKGKPVDVKSLVELAAQDAIERYITANPSISIQSKIDMLNERLQVKIQEEFLGKGVKYTEAEKKAIRKAYRGHYGGRKWKRSIFGLYQEFLMQQREKGYSVDLPEKEFDVYDLAALAYLYKRVKETEVISEAHHVVIDEAQDYGMMAYSVLKFCIKDCTYTVMGDVSQNIHFGYGLNDWEELKELLLSDEMDSFGVLKKSYRNTVEISDFATNILHHGSFSSYPVEPIIRHGNPVSVKRTPGREALFMAAAEVCRGWQEKGLDTIAVICRSREEAARAAKELGKHVPVMESDLEKAVFANGILVLPVDYTKGLEFDAVLILDPTREEYPTDDGHAKLLYVAATRALHELCVLHTGNLTGLIADPVPRQKRTRAVAAAGESRSSAAQADKTVPKKRISIVRNVQEKEGVAVQEESVPAQEEGVPTQRHSVSEAGASRAFQPQRSSQPAARPVIPPNKPRQPVSAPGSPYAVGGMSSRAGNSRPQPSAQRPAISFGGLPPTEKLRLVGHSRIDLSIRWAEKRADGLYLPSRYGTLRISPVGSAILRVTFVKGGQPGTDVNPHIAVRRTERAWMYKDNGKLVELTTDEACLQIDKASGAIRYLTRDKKLLVSERIREARQMEACPGGSFKSWLFLDWQKGENLYCMGTKEKKGFPLRGTAKYISHEAKDAELPLLLSDKGYGILLATTNPVICCDIPVYGSYLSVENEPWQDYYFLVGKKPETILNAYAYLCGRL